MILVLTGFHPVPFNRLITAMDEIAGQVEEEVIIQRGESKIRIKHARSIKYAGFKDNDELIKSARIVISHSGVGTILDCRRLDKQLIIVPRRMKLGESYDDHQFEIARVVSESKSAIMLDDISELKNTIESIQTRSFQGSLEEKGKIVSALKNVIKEISKCE
jgi:UDP-N-acetylglucosamine transferase subunit ALG13